MSKTKTKTQLRTFVVARECYDRIDTLPVVMELHRVANLSVLYEKLAKSCGYDPADAEDGETPLDYLREWNGDGNDQFAICELIDGTRLRRINIYRNYN